MKKTIILLSGMFVASNLLAQIIPGQNLQQKMQKAKYDKVDRNGDEVLFRLIANPNPTTSANLKTSGITETIIGTTTYDLQTNASVQDRLVLNADGTVSAAWTISQQFSTSYSDRGTGYNHFDGTSWGAQPTTRIESSRGGWPSMLIMGSGKEASITHNTANAYLNMAHRPAYGTGTWTEQIVSSQDSTTGVYRDMIWNRSAVGGLNNNVIHMIAVTASSNFGGLPFNGLDGALVYYRSQDEGVTWDIQDMQLPGMDTTLFDGMNGDSYAIDAQGEIVVIAYFNDWGDSFIVKSTDNGNTWTKTTFLNFPVKKYVIDSGLDLDGDFVMDQVYSTDNSGTVQIDDNGEAHVFYGIMMYTDDDLTDAGSSWFPSINGIAHWTESFGADTTPAVVHAGDTSLWYSDMMNAHWIMDAPDLNGDGTVGGVDTLGGYALYYASRASMPNLAFDANGNMWLSFSGYTETADNGLQVFRHVYITKSEDGGLSWKYPPVDVTPHDIWAGQQECVFACMNKVVDDKIRLTYQKDMEPGLTVRGDEDALGMNEIVYLEIDTLGLFDIISAINETKNTYQFGVYPNPANESTTIDIDLSDNTELSISVIDLLGRVVVENFHVGLNKGRHQLHLNVKEFDAGIYYINATIHGQVFTQKLIVN